MTESPESKILEASGTAIGIGAASAEIKVQRGRQTWQFLYTFLGFALTLEVGVISLIKPLDWWQKILAIAVIGLITTFVFLENRKFHGWILRVRDRYENKFR